MFQIYNGAEYFYQWDLGQKLIVNGDYCKLHFCNKTEDCALIVDVYEEDGKRLANVPNILLQSTNNIRVYGICKHENQVINTENHKIFRVIARGKPDEYTYIEWSAFWDVFQQKGARRTYNFAFINNGKCWDNVTFKPKYDIILADNATSAFYSWQGLAASVDIGKVLKDQGITLDTSRATNLNSLFAYGSSINGSLPIIDLSSAGANTSAMFDGTRLVTIEKLIVTTSTNFSNMFRNCTALENITFEGTIATGALNLTSCTKLTANSLKSVINCLSTSTSGLTVTLPTTAETTYNAKYGSGAWGTLIASKSNWSIAYA